MIQYMRQVLYHRGTNIQVGYHSYLVGRYGKAKIFFSARYATKDSAV